MPGTRRTVQENRHRGSASPFLIGTTTCPTLSGRIRLPLLTSASETQHGFLVSLEMEARFARRRGNEQCEEWFPQSVRLWTACASRAPACVWMSPDEHIFLRGKVGAVLAWRSRRMFRCPKWTAQFGSGGVSEGECLKRTSAVCTVQLGRCCYGDVLTGPWSTETAANLSTLPNVAI